VIGACRTSVFASIAELVLASDHFPEVPGAEIGWRAQKKFSAARRMWLAPTAISLATFAEPGLSNICMAVPNVGVRVEDHLTPRPEIVRLVTQNVRGSDIDPGLVLARQMRPLRARFVPLLPA
jgi:hypothetical protein